jgi:hypothetical protein
MMKDDLSFEEWLAMVIAEAFEKAIEKDHNENPRYVRGSSYKDEEKEQGKARRARLGMRVIE